MIKVSTKFDPINCNYTTWSPDHCKCTITYEWDKSTRDTPELREHRPVDPSVEIIGSSGSIVQHHIKCDDHKHLEDTKHHYESVLEENQRKNKAHFHMNEGKTVIEWYWDSDRVLHITGEIDKPKHEVQAIIDKDLEAQGHGKVVLH